MTSNIPRLADAALNWVEAILRCRISNDCIVRRDSDGVIFLSMPGASKRIRFSRNEVGFLGFREIDSVELWNSSSAQWLHLYDVVLTVPCNRSAHVPTTCTLDVSGVDLAFDLPGMIYWQLARVEEHHRKVSDLHDRFPATASHAFLNGYLERPVVDEWCSALAQMVKIVWPGVSLNDRLGRVIPSHDVDFPCRYSHASSRHLFRTVAKDVVERRFGALIRGIADGMKSSEERLPPGDPFNTFEWIMDQSDKFHLTSHFYFILGGKHPLDSGYDPTHPAIRSLMRDIHRRGHTLGLHPSYQCIDEPELLYRQFDLLRSIAIEENIEQSSWGCRMHYYRAAYPKLWRILHECGISRDATMGYADRVGFRAGTAHPYPAFDHIYQRSYDVLVEPLVAMEGTLASATYMNLSEPAEQRERLAMLRRNCMAYGGDFSLLWHNSELSDASQRDTYLAAIDPTK